MRDSLGLPVLANWVSMLRTDVSGAIIIVDDDLESRFYEKFQHDSARIVPCPGMAKELYSLVASRGIAGVASIVRARDFDSSLNGLLSPEAGDVISLLLTGTSFKKVIDSVAGANWMRACRQVGVDDPVVRAVEISYSLSVIEGDTGQNFDQLIFDLVDWKIFEVSFDKVSETFGEALANEWKLRRTEMIGNPIKNLIQMLDGSRLLKILNLMFARFAPLGVNSARGSNELAILELALVAYDLNDIENDKIFWMARAWERKNKKYPMLKQWRILDPLQMLWDQRYWESDLRVLLKDGGYTTAGLSAFKLDLDNFKEVNETLGHQGGDDAIRQACLALKECIADVAELYRRGGDELVAIAPDLRGDDARQAGERIRATIEKRMNEFGMAKGLKVSPTASIGIVDADLGSDFDLVIALMDKLQGQAKIKGKNCVEYERMPA